MGDDAGGLASCAGKGGKEGAGRYAGPRGDVLQHRWSAQVGFLLRRQSILRRPVVQTPGTRKEHWRLFTSQEGLPKGSMRRRESILNHSSDL